MVKSPGMSIINSIVAQPNASSIHDLTLKLYGSKTSRLLGNVGERVKLI